MSRAAGSEQRQGESEEQGRFAALVARTWNEDFLFSVMLELTYRCNLSCVFCYNDRRQHQQRSLTEQQYLQLLEDLAAMQVMQLCFSGGEPLTHSLLFSLGSRARQLGFVIRLKSNGHWLDRETAERLHREIAPFVVDISIHGASAASHDRQTRESGSFERLLVQLPAARQAGLRLHLRCILTAWNEHELDGIFALADRLEIPVAVDPVVTPTDTGDPAPLELAPSPEAVQHLERKLAERRHDRGDSPSLRRPQVATCCGAGVAALTIDPYGNVLPCVQWRCPVGNLHDAPIQEIWRDSAQLREVRRLNRKARQRVDVSGHDEGTARHCLGLSQMQTGSPLLRSGTARNR